jgi:hypothetical protein
MYNFGDVILTNIQFPDTYEIRTRAAVVLWEDQGNLVVAGVTSKSRERGIYLSKKDGAPKDSVIKTHYIFSISPSMVKRTLFTLSASKKKEIVNDLTKKLK